MAESKAEGVSEGVTARGINALRSALAPYYPTMDEQDLWLGSPHPLLGRPALGGVESVAPIDLVGTDQEERIWALIDQLDSGAVA